MPEPLEYASTRAPRQRPQWTGTIITAAVLGAVYALLLAGGYHSAGLFPEERVRVLIVIVASAVCVVVGGVRVSRMSRSNTWLSVLPHVLGLVLAAVLDTVATWACLTAYPLR